MKLRGFPMESTSGNIRVSGKYRVCVFFGFFACELKLNLQLESSFEM